MGKNIWSSVKVLYLEVQWHMSKPNLFETNFCVRNREAIGLYRLF
jgi:hypothetical protein